MAIHGQIEEYRNIDKADLSKVTRLDTRSNKGREYFLDHASEGWEPAGSCARYTNGYFAVRFMLDGATHGQRFKLTDESKARALFAKWTRPACDPTCAACDNDEHGECDCPCSE